MGCCTFNTFHLFVCEAEARMRACNLNELGPSRCERSIVRASCPGREEVQQSKRRNSKKRFSCLFSYHCIVDSRAFLFAYYGVKLSEAGRMGEGEKGSVAKEN